MLSSNDSAGTLERGSTRCACRLRHLRGYSLCGLLSEYRLRAGFSEEPRHESLAFRDPLHLDGDRVNCLLHARQSLSAFRSGLRLSWQRPAFPEQAGKRERDRREHEDREDDRDGNHVVCHGPVSPRVVESRWQRDTCALGSQRSERLSVFVDVAFQSSNPRVEDGQTLFQSRLVGARGPTKLLLETPPAPHGRTELGGKDVRSRAQGGQVLRRQRRGRHHQGRGTAGRTDGWRRRHGR